MNKITLAMNAWRAYTAARRTEGSSLRSQIIGAIAVVSVIAITLLRGDLTAADVSSITAGLYGLDKVLQYFIPDKLGTSDGRPSIALIGKSQAVCADNDASLCAGDSHSDSDRLPQRPVRSVHNTDEAADNDFPGWGS